MKVPIPEPQMARPERKDNVTSNKFSDMWDVGDDHDDYDHHDNYDNDDYHHHDNSDDL